jgi:hypothetical protein
MTNKVVKILKNRWLFFGAVSMSVCLFFYQYLATGDKLIEGDFDYYAQVYEAFRISVLEYGQFPSWNPWMVGGLPLYANPQFGLFSIQSVLVLIFGTLYGLKLAYVMYALSGFWGMYLLGRQAVKASRLRACLIGFIWIACGFFAGHGIMHFTFALFFLLPLLILLIYRRREKWSWLWFGLLETLILLSSVHYAFLMTSLVAAVFLCLSFFEISLRKTFLHLRVSREDMLFILKTFLVVLILAGPRLLSTLIFVSNNERIVEGGELYPRITDLFSALFLPIASYLPVPTPLQWGWWEYSMYIGMGAALAFFLCIIVSTGKLWRKSHERLLDNGGFVISIIIIGVLGVFIALGDFGTFSPYNLLHHIPGFTQTRVPSRWLLLTAFAILVFLMAWKRNPKLINTLLILSVVELFFLFGPIRRNGADQIIFSPPSYSHTFTQYDNQHQHLDMTTNINHSYYYSTRKNVGQIYADDSLVNTLNNVYGSAKCGINTNKKCDFVLSHNATIEYWSPNVIILQRQSPGSIELNMNPQADWIVNNQYVFANQKRVDPGVRFLIPDDKQQTYRLEYAPRFSPKWIQLKYF